MNLLDQLLYGTVVVGVAAIFVAVVYALTFEFTATMAFFVGLGLIFSVIYLAGALVEWVYDRLK